MVISIDDLQNYLFHKNIYVSLMLPMYPPMIHVSQFDQTKQLNVKIFLYQMFHHRILRYVELFHDDRIEFLVFVFDLVSFRRHPIRWLRK
jgi:hypothetical protein